MTTPTPEPVALIDPRALERGDASMHCITRPEYRSAADVDAGVEYVPVYTADQLRAAIDAALAAQAEYERANGISESAAGVPLTDGQILSCVRAIGPRVPMGLTRDRGPYEVTEPTWFLTQLVRTIEAAHGITASPDAQQDAPCTKT